jgi:hypothetical protein
MCKLIPVEPNKLEECLAFVRNGGRLCIPTYTRITMIDKKALARFEKAGTWLLKAEGDGYRMHTGKSSVFILPGQLKAIHE